MSDSEQEPSTVGGREIVAYVEHTKRYSNRIISITPIAADGAQGYSFSEGMEGQLTVWGIESDRGQRIQSAYDSGKLPCKDRDKINRILDGEPR